MKQSPNARWHANVARATRVLLGIVLSVLVSLPARADLVEPDTEYLVFHHRDVLGTAIATTDSNGNVVHHTSTTPYGRDLGRRADDGQGFSDNAYPSSRSGEGYTGHVNDRQLELTYMRARFYDPVLGRFLSNDPVGFTSENPTSFNRYAYANNSPYKYVDPDGRYATDYNADNVGDFVTSEAARMLEHGEARAVLASDFTLEDSMAHFQSGSGIPIVVTGSLDVYERIGKGPYGEGCGSADGTCQREVGTRGSTFFVHGRLTANLGPANDVISLEPESYGFESDPNASLARNTNTAIGGRLHGQGTEYMIHYSHRARLRSFFGFRR